MTLIKIHFHLPEVFKDVPWSGGINGSLWTLPKEIQMYLLVFIFGFMGILKEKKTFNLLVIVICFSYLANPSHFPLIEKPG